MPASGGGGTEKKKNFFIVELKVDILQDSLMCLYANYKHYYDSKNIHRNDIRTEIRTYEYKYSYASTEYIHIHM